MSKLKVFVKHDNNTNIDSVISKPSWFAKFYKYSKKLISIFGGVHKEMNIYKNELIIDLSGVDKIPELLHVGNSEGVIIYGDFSIENYINSDFMIRFITPIKFSIDPYTYIHKIESDYSVYDVNCGDLDNTATITYSMPAKDNQVIICCDYSSVISITKGVVVEILNTWLIDEIIKVIPKTYITDLKYNVDPTFKYTTALKINVNSVNMI